MAIEQEMLKLCQLYGIFLRQIDEQGEGEQRVKGVDKVETQYDNKKHLQWTIGIGCLS